MAEPAVVVFRMDPEEARVAWHALAGTVEIMAQVGEIPPDAPLHGQKDRLIALAQRLDHQVNHAQPASRHDNLASLLATGEGFALIYRANFDPGQFCRRIMDLPSGSGQPEPLDRWRTRAVMAALGAGAA